MYAIKGITGLKCYPNQATTSIHNTRTSSLHLKRYPYHSPKEEENGIQPLFIKAREKVQQTVKENKDNQSESFRKAIAKTQA